jgi:uncharacterized protein with HEPN domain
MLAAHRDWRLLVEDIVEYATEIERMTVGMDEAAFRANRIVQLAVTHSIEIMGEAAHHVPPDIQARCPDVGWRQMNDMRNVLIHAYAIVNLGLIWDAVTKDVTPTRERLARFLADEQASGE